jgi:FtsH-binding integral membrane protein
MENILSRFSNGLGSYNPQVLMKMTDITPSVQKHLKDVYLALALATTCASIAAVFNLYTGFGSLLGVFGFIISAIWLSSTPSTPSTLNKRTTLLCTAAASQGLSLGPLIGAAISIDPTILVLAFAGTATVFASFSAAALLSKRRSYLYLGGMLSSVLSTFMMMRFATLFIGGGALLFQAELYIGLFVFMGYVLFDTQLIVERAEAGDRDYIKHALDLFVDLAAIFVRLVVILMKNAQEKQTRKEAADRKKRRD